MTVKINMAIDISGKIVHIRNAVRGNDYFCIYCGDYLYATLGDIQTHHFRHKSKDSESKYCHLYSSGKNDYSILYNKEIWKNKPRFVIDEEFKIQLKLPTLSRESYIKMVKEDLYFSIYVDNQEKFSTHLNEVQNKNYVPVEPAKKYNISYKYKQNAQTLNYDIINEITLLDKTTLLFKNISGEFINIPYPKTSLSEEFFILSSRKLTLSNNFKIKKYKTKHNYFLYHLFIDEVNIDVINWFSKNTHYTVVPNRKWIDLIYPNNFSYKNSTLLVDSEYVTLQVTPFSHKDTLIFKDEYNYFNSLSFMKNGTLTIDLAMNHTYNFSLKHEIANCLSIKRVKSLSNEGHLYNIQVNNQPLKSFKYLDKDYIKITSEKEFYIYNNIDIPLSTKRFQNKLNWKIHFPFIGTIQAQKKSKERSLNKEFLQLVSNHEVWVPVNPSLYKKLINEIKKINTVNKNNYLKILYKNYNKLPYKLLKNLKGEL